MKKYHRKGFTTIEILTVIGIIAVLAAVAVPSYGLMKRNVSFTNTVEEVANALREAQNLSMASQDGEKWEVEFDHDSISGLDYYSLTSVAGTSSRTRRYDLNEGIKIQPVPSAIVFNRLNGTTDNYAEVIVKQTGKQVTIAVDKVGKISIGSVVVP